jgi:predicted amidohydrolase YtcJ
MNLILTGGRVLTVDGAFSVAEAVAVRGNRVAAVGTDAEIRALAGPSTVVIELNGRTVLPGINDSHLHGAAYGMTKLAVDVSFPTVRSIVDIAAAVSRAVPTVPPGAWIIGTGWDQGYLDECRAQPGRLPNRHDLDAVAPDNPVCLTDFSAHMTWVNSAALRLAGLEGSGILREAEQLAVQRLLPEPTIAQRRAAIEHVVGVLHRRGITSYTEPGLGPGGAGTLLGGLSTENWTAYTELVAESALRARVSVLLLPAPMGGSAADLRDGLATLGAVTSPDPHRLRAIGVKIFADGVPPNRTAWMHQPYCDGGHGALSVHGDTPAHQADELAEMIRIAHAAGFQVGVHATGDRTIDTAVDAFVAANAEHPRANARHYIIHGDFVSAASLAKLAAHGYGINMNPAIKWTIADLMDGVVGAERSAYQWPVRAAVEAGVPVCASSDAPVTEPDWRQGIAGMLLRESKASGRVSGPDQRVGLEAALRAYTINPARQDFAEAWKGSIEVGKVADLCVLGGDLLHADPHELTSIAVDLTMVDGEIVFEAG